VNGDGSLDAADAAALLAAVYAGWNEDGTPNEGDGERHAASVTYAEGHEGGGQAVLGFPGMGSRVRFTALPAPVGVHSGRDVALLGSRALVADWRGGGLTVVDVVQPLSATVMARLPFSDRTYGVTAANGLVYVSDPQEAADRLAVLDFRDPLTPTLAAALTVPGEVMESALISDRLYVAAGYAGLHVIDVTDAQTPTLLGTFDTPGIATDVSAAGDIVYVADQDNGLLIYRTGPITPAEPITLSLLATWDTPGAAIGVTAALSTVYVADGLGGIHVVDTSDPGAPRLLANYATASAANSTVLSGTTLFVADGWQGVLALDVTDPAAPTLAGSFDTPGYAHDLVLAGDLLLVADGPGGLQLLRVEQEAAPDHYLLIPLVIKQPAP